MKKKKAALGEKATKTMAVLFAAAVLSLGGIAINRMDNSEEELLDLNEKESAENTRENSNVEMAKNESIEKKSEEITEYDSEFGMDNVMDATDEYIPMEELTNTAQVTDSEKTENISDQEVASADVSENSAETEEQPQMAATASSSITSTLAFSEESTLLWPVDGNVLLNYNMDSTVYFATLEQYKYNPAIIIQGDVGALVSAAADGVVENIFEDPEIGTTVVMNLGNNYKATYGQLQNLQINIGSAVKKGDIIGEVSEPTKYYSVEGSNLYFKLEKDSQSKDPLNYLE